MMTRFNPDLPATAADFMRNITAAHWHHQLNKRGDVYHANARRDLELAALMMGYRLMPALPQEAPALGEAAE